MCSSLEDKSTDLDAVDLQSHEENTNPRLAEIERLIGDRHYFRSKSPNPDLQTDEYTSDCDDPRSQTTDSFGNPVPVVPINLNDYLNENTESKPLPSTGDQVDPCLRLVNFETHQEELAEMHKQMQIMRQNQRNSTDTFARLSLDEQQDEASDDRSTQYEEATFDTTSTIVKQEPSSQSRSSSFDVIGSISASGAPSNFTNNLHQSFNQITLPQSFALDPESVQFAVSALLSSNQPPAGQNVMSAPGPAIAATAVTNTTPRQPDSSSLDVANNGPSHLQPFDEWQSKPDLDPKCKIKFSASGPNSHSVVESNLASTDVT
jgi:hypothetical protein